MSHKTPRIALILPALGLFAATSKLAAQATITEFSLPVANSQPVSIVAGPDGAMWFTEFINSKIGRITTAGVITEFKLPAGDSGPTGLTVGPDGALWYSVNSYKIGRMTTAGVVTDFSLPTSNSAFGLTSGPDGAVWFVGNGKVGRITTSGVITQFAVPIATFGGGAPGGDIRTGPDGALWFTANQLGHVTTAGVVTDFTMPPPSYTPDALTAGPDGAMWFSLGGAIARITTAGVITQFPIPNLLGQVAGAITTGPDGALWFTFTFTSSNFVGQLTTTGTYTQYKLPTLNSEPWGIATGPDGALWVTERIGNKIARILPTPTGYTCTNTTTPLITSLDSASAYGGYPYFASGSWLEIKGTNLADASDPRLSAATNPGQWTAADFNGSNAPTELDGISVSINGKPAYVWYLSPGQLNVQAPEDTATGNVTIALTNCKATSSPFSFTRRALAPGFLAPPNYTANGTQYMVATFASDGAYVLNTSTGASFGLNSRPAKPGDLIVAYGIGFGDVTPSILPGIVVGQGNALANPISLSFGSTSAALSYAGLAGGFVGLYEFYITVTQGLANGDYQINVQQNGVTVPQTMFLTVHN